ncbi:MAG: hypothetical protein Ta2F_13510 [Termitinemataceae bacterium]|nr:MAG: hypothetical protein Ta2F_13510 [Termitinemataceae bacterium]
MLKLMFNVVLLFFLSLGQGNAQGKTAEWVLEKTYAGSVYEYRKIGH